MADNKVSFIQANIQHCRAAVATLRRHLDDAKETIALIQEPWCVKGKVCGFASPSGSIFATLNVDRPRTCIYIPRRIQANMLPQFCAADITTVRISCDMGAGQTDVIIASIYLPIDSKDPPPSKEMLELVDFCEAGNKHLIIGCDTNAHHTAWGSRSNNKRGKSLVDYFITTNLEIINRGDEPTFVNSRCQTVIDVTLASMNISNTISGWHVSSEASMSDHRWIKFTLKCSGIGNSPYRDPRKTDRALFLQHLARSLGETTVPQKITSTGQIEESATLLRSRLVDAFEGSCRLRTRASGSRATPWWSTELGDLRGKCRKLFNKAKNSRSNADWDAYSEHRKAYKRMIRQRQREAWRLFCSGIESTTSAARLKKIISKDPNQQPGSLRRGDGTFTANLADTAALLLNTHFPGCKPTPSLKWAEYVTPTPSTEDWAVAARTVCEEKVNWAVKTFLPFKSPGMDGVYPALLQWGLDVILIHLVRIFRACIAFRYIPEQWREVRVVFIPKPGKTDYSTAKSYRPISLTSFLLKTLERLCDREIREVALRDHPLHPNQHAYIPGRSTDSALHSVVSRIERSLENKMFTLGLYIDIEGAFDQPSFDSISRSLGEHGVTPAISGLIRHVLERRAIQVSVGECTIRGIAGKGCPQGGVLSPLIWNILVDDLLHLLNESGFHTIAYADDLTILLTGKYEGVLCSLMQSALRIIEKWCAERSLSVNPTKTDLILFTKKRKLNPMVLPKLKGTQLRLVNEVKYLGVVLDSKLGWGRHLESRVNKACMAFWQCRRAVGRSWGLSPKITLWLYTAVIRPMLCYGSLVWWPRTRQKVEMAHINHVQRLVCLAVTGVMKSTPTAALEAILCLPPLDIFVQGMALGSALRLRDGKLWNARSVRGGHAAILDEASGRVPLLGALADRIPVKYNFTKHYRIDLDSSQKRKPDISIFTDGSKNSQGSGSGIYSEELGLRESIALGKFATVFQAELFAVIQGANIAIDKDVYGKTIQIVVDSKAVLQTLRRHKVNSGLVWECHCVLEYLSNKNVVELVWVKGHTGNLGNEEADRLARRGSHRTSLWPEPTLALATATLSTLVKEDTLKRHAERWLSTEHCKQGRAAIQTPCPKIARFCLQLSRYNLRRLVGIWTGHCRLNKHLHRMGVVNDPSCRGCYVEDETAEHVICHCPALSSIREAILRDSWPDMASIGDASPGVVLRLINAIGWLDD